ncbi:hypothetical protein NC651_018392 [Populus alba x Populus x berolinensis]|nr:hypothetical protein NC651_018392 [Populus alba x Populus x berolinensis]
MKECGKSKVLTHEGMVRVYWKKNDNESPGREVNATGSMFIIFLQWLAIQCNETRESIFFSLLDAEFAHKLAVSAAARGLAAGFDKNAEAVDGLLGLGFGFVEVGSVTPVPQEGNPKPQKCFGDDIYDCFIANINLCGCNSEGMVAVAKRLGAQHGKRKLDETSSASSTSNNKVINGGKDGPGILGVNLGKNKTSEDAAADYVQGVHTMSQYSDYLVINVSSPNTPGLRMLQGRKQLKDLVKKVQAARDEMQWGEEGPPPLLVKIAPDLSKEDLEDIAAVSLALRLDGLAFSATGLDYIEYNHIKARFCKEIASGGGNWWLEWETSPQFAYQYLKRDVYFDKVVRMHKKKIRAGATLVQLYTGFAYGGPALIPRMKLKLLAKLPLGSVLLFKRRKNSDGERSWPIECLERDGFKSILEAVGADYR